MHASAYGQCFARKLFWVGNLVVTPVVAEQSIVTLTPVFASHNEAMRRG